MQFSKSISRINLDQDSDEGPILLGIHIWGPGSLSPRRTEGCNITSRLYQASDIARGIG